jgi:hypothetical protein
MPVSGFTVNKELSSPKKTNGTEERHTPHGGNGTDSTKIA